MSSFLSTESVEGRAGSQAIAATLRRAILRGDLPAGAQLPSIGELSRRHGTTAVTARKALSLLEAEGLVRVEHGVGTFVARWQNRFDLLHLPSFSAELAAREIRSETRVVGTEASVRKPEAARALGLLPEAALCCLARVRLVAGAPIVFQRSYLDGALAALVQSYRPDRSLYEALAERLGRTPHSAEEEIAPVALPAAVAGELAALPGAPGLRAVRTTFDLEGHPMIFDEAFFSGERVRLRVRRRPTETLLEYALTAPAEED